MEEEGVPIGRRVARDILRYLVDNPEAKDTLDGIVTFWFPEGEVKWGREEIQEAVDALVSKGWMTKRETTPSKKIYGLNNDRIEEIRAFLSRPEDRSKGEEA